MKYYELNPESPYYQYMQDTTVENSLSDEEKDGRYRTQLAGILFGMYEGADFTEHEKNYFIYAMLNKVPPEIAFNNMQRAEGKPEIDFYEVNRRREAQEKLNNL